LPEGGLAVGVLRGGTVALIVVLVVPFESEGIEGEVEVLCGSDFDKDFVGVVVVVEADGVGRGLPDLKVATA
jgi:hypothetical protein